MTGQTQGIAMFIKHYLVNLNNYEYSFKVAIQRCQKILKISWSFSIQPKGEMYSYLQEAYH